MSQWQQLEVTVAAHQAEEIAHLLSEHGALSVSLEDGANEPLFQLLPNETPLWSETRVVALFAEQADLSKIIEQVQVEINQPLSSYQISFLEDQDWVRQTQQNFPPQCFAENLWVIPSWCDSQNYGKNTLRIDPGLAFGTGTHPTTALCLEWLAQHPPQGLSLIDFGCGSGILALAALVLGAQEAYAIDHDPQALQATANNAALNALGTKQLHIVEELPAQLKVPLILANILSQPLISLAPYFSQLTSAHGCLILSGILSAEIDAIAQAYAPYFQLTSAKTREEWVQLSLLRK